MDRSTIIADVFAGLTGAAVLLPQAIAFSEIAGLPPQYGIYSAFAIPIIAALYGSSWHLVSGPTTAISLVIFATLTASFIPGSPDYVRAAFTLTLLVGMFQLALGFARLGQLMNVVSHSVLLGFTSGAAILIIMSQIRVLIGPVAVEGVFDAILNEDSLGVIASGINPYVMGIAGLTFFVAAVVKRLAPKWPNYLVALATGSVAAWLVDARSYGVEFVDPIASALPGFQFPNLNVFAVQNLSQGAFAIALIGILEAVSISRSIAARTGQNIDSGQEIVGQGLSNLVGALFSSYAGSGSFTRSALNLEAGAKTPLSAILSSVFLLLAVYFLVSFVSYLPVAAIAGLIILIAWRLIDLRQIRHIATTSPAETLIFGFTICAVLVFNLELAIFGGIILSLGIFLRNTMRVAIPVWAPNQSSGYRSFVSSERPGVQECPQAVFARMQGPLYFGAGESIKDSFRRIAEARPLQKHLVLGIDGSIGMDFSGAELLAEEARRRKARNGGLYLIVKYPRLREQVVQYRLSRALGSGHIFRRKSDAIPRVIRRLDSKICADCKMRIFLECPASPNRNED